MKDRRAVTSYDYTTIQEMFINTTKNFSSKVGFLEKRPGHNEFKEITYREFRKDVVNLGCGLIEKLKLKGEKIAIIGENSYQWAVSYFAVACGTGIVVPIDKELPAQEIVTLINRSKAKAIIYSTRKKEIIASVAEQMPTLNVYIEMYPNESTYVMPKNKKNKNYTIDEVMKLGKGVNEKVLLGAKIDPDEFKILLFTSGTTSTAKGVMLSNRNIMVNCNEAIKIVHLYPDDRFFSILPIHHSYESTVGMMIPICYGLSIAYCGGLKSIANDLKETHPTVLLVVPALIENLISKVNKGIEKQDKGKIVDAVIRITNPLGNFGKSLKLTLLKDIHANLGGKVRLVVSAAAPIDPEVGKRLQDFGIIFSQGYGLTETSPLTALVPSDRPNNASVGIAAGCCKVKVMNPNEDGIGEIWIKGENLTQGYYEDETQTLASFTDGWFHSGDLGYIDDKGYIYLTGRSKNLILTGNGKNVFPEEIEYLVNKIPYVKESMVYAAINPKGEKESIIAVKVTLDNDYIKEQYKGNIPSDTLLHDTLWEEIKKVNQQLAGYKWIKQLEIKKDDFKKTTTMKIKRYEEISK